MSKSLRSVRLLVETPLTPLENAMKYLCLIYDDEKRLNALSSDEGRQMSADYGAYTQDIKKSGHYKGGDALERTTTASTVRVRNGTVSTTDGPFAETKEQLGGYYVIEARDLNDAIQVASRIPSAKAGSIEVRPIRPNPAGDTQNQ